MILLKLFTQIITFKILVIDLGKDNYGFYTLLWYVFGYTLLLDFGFGTTMQKYSADVTVTNDYENYNKQANTIFCLYCMLSLVILGFTIFGTIFLDKLFVIKKPENLTYYRNVFLIFGLLTTLQYPLGAFQEILRGLKRFDLLNYVNFCSTIIFLSGIILILKVFKGSVLSVSIFVLLVNLSTNIAAAVISYRLIPYFKLSFRYFKLRNIKEIGHFPLFAYIITMANVIIYRTDPIVLGSMLGMAQVTIYEIGKKVAVMLDMISTQFQSTLAPVAASLFKAGEDDKLRTVLVKSNKMTAYISTGFFLCFLILAKPILQVWVKADNDLSFSVAYIMLTSFYIKIMFTSASAKFLLMAGRHKVLSVITMLEAVSNIVLSVILVWHIGLLGVAFGTLIPTVFFGFFVIFPIAASFGRIPLKDYFLKVYIPVFLISLPTIVILLAGRIFIPEHAWNISTLIAIGLPAGLIYFLMGAFVYANQEEREELMKLLPLDYLYSGMNSNGDGNKKD